MNQEPNIWALLDRYFAGECSAAERAMIKRWVDGDPERAAELERLRELWRQAGTVGETYDTDAAWRTVQRQVLLPPAPRRTWIHQGMAIAASVLVAVAIGAGILVRRDMASRTYATARGEQLTITLSDGSRVTLAPESRLQLATTFGGERRDLTLTGEAYFAVTHNAARPFAVHAGNATAVDVGTEFDVRAYASDSIVSVGVTEGQVMVVSGHTQAALAAGQSATVDRSAQVVRERSSSATPGEWRTGRLAFHDVPVPTVAADLGRWYDVDITVDTSLLTERLTAEWTNVPRDRVLHELADAINARIQRHGRRVTLSRRLAGATPE